jgi:hypothetical protein
MLKEYACSVPPSVFFASLFNSDFCRDIGMNSCLSSARRAMLTEESIDGHKCSRRTVLFHYICCMRLLAARKRFAAYMHIYRCQPDSGAELLLGAADGIYWDNPSPYTLVQPTTFFHFIGSLFKDKKSLGTPNWRF